MLFLFIERGKPYPRIPLLPFPTFRNVLCDIRDFSRYTYAIFIFLCRLFTFCGWLYMYQNEL